MKAFTGTPLSDPCCVKGGRFSADNVGTLRHMVEELSLICQHPILADNNEDFDGLMAEHMMEQSSKFEVLDAVLHGLQSTDVPTLILTQSHKAPPPSVSRMGVRFRR